jgi:tetratricopeptide (TPR) repeat protein
MDSSGRALLSAVALVAVEASALANAPKVLVLPYQHLAPKMPEDLGEQTTAVVTREMAHGGLSVIRADDVTDAAGSAAPKADPAGPIGDPAAGPKADQLIVDAKSLMEESEFEQASKVLKKAVDLLEANADAVPDLRLLPEAYLQLGVAYFRDGLEDEGDDMLNKAVHLDPERTLAEADYPPIFIKVYERARFNVLRRPRAQIEVKATPGAAVLFDGRNLGKAPIRLEDALPGEHWVRVERAGEAPQVKKIQASSKKTLVVEFEGGEKAEEASAAVGVLGAIGRNEIAEEHKAQLASAGRRAGADLVMFGAIYPTDTSYHIHTAYVRVKDGSVGRLVDIAFDLDMLSAEIEVYKLAEDAKKEASAGSFANPVSEKTFALAPKFKPRATRQVVAGAKETKMTVVAAAPQPIKPPASLYAENVAPPPPSSDRKPTAAAPPPPKATALPKDEVAPKEEPKVVASTIVIEDEQEGGGGSNWWIWALVGVAAAGAVAAGGYFIVQGTQSPDEGSLTVRW